MKFLAWSLLVSLFAEPIAIVGAEGARPSYASPPAIQLPAHLGIVESTHFATSSKRRLILIQDAHANPSAQRKIARSLESIFSKLNVKYVFMEAGSGNLSLSSLRDEVSAEVRLEVGEKFMKRTLLQGSEYFDLTSQHDVILHGVENPSLYAESLDLYSDVAKDRTKAQVHHQKILSVANALKKSIYGPRLFAFKAMQYQYNKKAISAPLYWQELVTQAQILSIPKKLTQNLSQVQAMHVLEGSIDYEAALVEWENFTDNQDGFKYDLFEPLTEEGAIFQKEFYQRAIHLLKANKIQLKPDSALNIYLDYLRRLQNVNMPALLDEVSVLEQKISFELALTKDAKTLIQVMKYLKILNDLLEMKLQPQDYSLIREKKAKHILGFVEGFINMKLMQLQQDFQKTIFRSEHYESIIDHAIEFYELTLKRDKAFLKNIFEIMQLEGQELAVFVVGGFHTQHLESMLTQLRIDHDVIHPSVLHATNHATYERLLLSQDILKDADGMGLGNTISLLPVKAGGNLSFAQLRKEALARERDYQTGISSEVRMAEPEQNRPWVLTKIMSMASRWKMNRRFFNQWLVWIFNPVKTPRADVAATMKRRQESSKSFDLFLTGEHTLTYGLTTLSMSSDDSTRELYEHYMNATPGSISLIDLEREVELSFKREGYEDEGLDDRMNRWRRGVWRGQINGVLIKNGLVHSLKNKAINTLRHKAREHLMLPDEGLSQISVHDWLDRYFDDLVNTRYFSVAIEGFAEFIGATREGLSRIKFTSLNSDVFQSFIKFINTKENGFFDAMIGAYLSHEEFHQFEENVQLLQARVYLKNRMWQDLPRPASANDQDLLKRYIHRVVKDHVPYYYHADRVDMDAIKKLVLNPEGVERSLLMDEIKREYADHSHKSERSLLEEKRFKKERDEELLSLNEMLRWDDESPATVYADQEEGTPGRMAENKGLLGKRHVTWGDAKVFLANIFDSQKQSRPLHLGPHLLTMNIDESSGDMLILIEGQEDVLRVSNHRAILKRGSEGNHAEAEAALGMSDYQYLLTTLNQKMMEITEGMDLEKFDDPTLVYIPVDWLDLSYSDIRTSLFQQMKSIQKRKGFHQARFVLVGSDSELERTKVLFRNIATPLYFSRREALASLPESERTLREVSIALFDRETSKVQNYHEARGRGFLVQRLGVNDVPRLLAVLQSAIVEARLENVSSSDKLFQRFAEFYGYLLGRRVDVDSLEGVVLRKEKSPLILSSLAIEPLHIAVGRQMQFHRLAMQVARNA